MKKTKLIFTALFAMSVLAALALSGCEEPDPEYTVKYEITGPATVASYLSYCNGKDVTELENVNIPWSITISFKKNKYVALSVRISNDSTYTATIYINGILKTSQSNKQSVNVATGTYH